MIAPDTNAAERPKLVAAICTYNRNEPLANLLEALVVNAERIKGRAAVGVVIVDDSKDGNARHVVERFADRFELGAHYRISGRQNIALARNTGLEAALQLADWIAMTDDDCEPAPDWLEALLTVQQRTGAEGVSGQLRRRVPPGSPSWLTDEPFLDAGLLRDVKDGEPLEIAATHNSMISARWLRERPQIRFDSNFGVTGGEDPVFYRTAHAAGLRIHFAANAVVFENEPPSRATLSYQLRVFFWLGNNGCITSIRQGVPPLRMLLHGVKVLCVGLVRPLGRLLRGKSPQVRYGLAQALQGAGVITGLFGLRVRHS